MKVLLVMIQSSDIMGHVFPDDPNTIHYVKDGVRHESSINEVDYIVIEELEIAQEEV